MNIKLNRRFLFTAIAATGSVAALEAQEVGVSKSLFTVGAVEVRPSFAYAVNYDDNIFLQHKSGNKEEDIQHTFSPGVTLGYGDYRSQKGVFVSANYLANFLVFQDNSGANATTHNANLAIGGGDKLSWRFDQTLVSDADADVQNLAAGGRLRRDIWNSTFSSIYDLSDRTDLETRFTSIFSDYGEANVNTFDTWRGEGAVMLDYEMTSKIHYALGGGAGYDQVDGGLNSVYENINTRLVWSVSPKLALRTGLGVNFRQTQGASASMTTFTFDVASDWKLSALTVVSLGAARGVSPSNVLLNQAATRTTVTGQLTHKIGERYTANLLAGYMLSETSSNGAATAVAQEDNYWYIRPSAALKLMDRAALAAYYQFRRNDSDVVNNGNDFTNHQVGMSLSYAF